MTPRPGFFRETDNPGPGTEFRGRDAFRRAAQLGHGVVEVVELALPGHQGPGGASGILQGLCAAGQVPVTAVVPLLLGQNIGTCATALLASLPGTREARAVALAHLGFNCVGPAALLPLWLLVTPPPAVATPLGVAMVHTSFNLATCALFCALRAAVRLLRRQGAPGRQ